ncbi:MULTISPECIES: ATP-dependent nuclease [Mycobacteriaceae]|uniref:Chromosome segregation protein SMC n=1 Tax=Mycolicibacterium neoaurum VKM Ac-1815D TaxID=700508 RepID=V5X9N4_MYCNE|nr:MULTISPECIES: AAA family ATPase [Mycobacteriaceae]AHC24712.1 chromosome segregation protein SMC [Mycolicibacterium neoaurum VKM Ac-1815D]AMO05267.1 chromosome segregation protein SMC [Mycolicibacterium neoaurum]AXK76423.1 ATP-dependent endonuclease [Mycolicibacterium neoaurum]KJQ49306.1 chromosome segregation protein SMC [Mycolicibacterium neoaurum]KUM08429.1 ATP-dependent endonuclease [Mycolicibacterium neoaurum]
MLQRIVIKNFKSYETFGLDFNEDINIIVGDNEAGKSTLLEAINLVLTGRVAGRPIQSEISPHLFNQSAAQQYLKAVNAGSNPMQPEIIVDLFLKKDPETAHLTGTNNLEKIDKPGIRLRIAYNDEYAEEYSAFIAAKTASTIPVEYYKVEWLAFSGNPITQRGIPVAASMINAANIRLQNGADYYLQKIIKGHLTDQQRTELSRAYRDLKQTFAANDSISAINDILDQAKGDVSDKTFKLGIDVSQQSGWESGLVPHLDDLPFTMIGSGEQNTMKILLAINRRLEESHAILIEEPENHLSYATLNKLISKIEDKCKERQVIITTHSSYVINKLGLGKLILLHEQQAAKMTDLDPTTQDYFMKLSGYDTLRLVLARETIIVEGPSDELVVQRAYMDTHGGRLPIHDGIDVLNARGLSSKRFLEIAAHLKKPVHVVTDNDGKPEAVDEKFKDFAPYDNITIHRSDDATLPSLEDHILAVNGREKMNRILGKSFTDDAKILAHMKNDNNKTTGALAIFGTQETVTMPEYIFNAIK